MKDVKVVIRKKTTKTVKLKAGLKEEFKKSPICTNYQCVFQFGGDSLGADIVMFNIDSLQHYQTPPVRDPGALWVFQTTEPPWLNITTSSAWDGVFNYSVIYKADTFGSRYSFRDTIKRKPIPETYDFAALNGKRWANALWFTSHCGQNHKVPVTSARETYATELAKYIHIDVFTKTEDCMQLLRPLVRNDMYKVEPKMKEYTFYLAFENSLCEDYITEKLWKVLEDDESYTIPVVLGGLSIDEYRKVAPPNSFIHVKNFTSIKALADHLKFVAGSAKAFNYYMQWRNEYTLENKGTFTGT